MGVDPPPHPAPWPLRRVGGVARAEDMLMPILMPNVLTRRNQAILESFRLAERQTNLAVLEALDSIETAADIAVEVVRHRELAAGPRY
jgi:hypothetical protein